MPPTPPTDKLLTLKPGDVHLWVVEPEQVTTPWLLAEYRALLDADERERQVRFYFERHRQQFLVSHALVRVVLSRYAPVSPRDWRFTPNEYGRPAIVGEGLSWLRFNLSHTDGMAVCAVARDTEVGTDVEDSHRSGQTVEIADSFFAPSEVAALLALPTWRQRERFFEYWTLKESYIKARGMGLSLPLAHFAFHLEPGQAPRIAFDPRLVDEPEAWQFMQLRPSARHYAAVALRQPRSVPLTVRLQRLVPLGEEGPVQVLSTT
jgi:4'-phosphopantetheinyl transferase